MNIKNKIFPLFATAALIVVPAAANADNAAAPQKSEKKLTIADMSAGVRSNHYSRTNALHVGVAITLGQSDIGGLSPEQIEKKKKEMGAFFEKNFAKYNIPAKVFFDVAPDNRSTVFSFNFEGLSSKLLTASTVRQGFNDTVQDVQARIYKDHISQIEPK